MAISLFNSYSTMLESKQIGELWQPKRSAHRVGDDIGLISTTSMPSSAARNVVVGNGDDVSLKTFKLFNAAKSAAQSGFNIRSFRTLGDERITAALASDGASITDGSAIYDKGNRMAFIRDGSLKVYEKKQTEADKLYGSYELKLIDEVKITGDMRVSWDAENNPVFHTGEEALTGGKLEAQSDNEILIRKNGADVVAGNGSVVFNMSSREGTFSGGNGATFLGSYTGSTFRELGSDNVFGGYFSGVTISELGGQATFSGVFEESRIEASDYADTFSGYFSQSNINGGKGSDTFSGLFINESKISGGDDADAFNGRFIASSLDGGAGNDVFGDGFNLNELATLQSKSEVYKGLESDFINSTLEGGEGDDKLEDAVWGGRVNLGEGNDKTSGVFTGVMVDGGEGDDMLTAMYAANSVFSTGLGNDDITLSTAVNNVVNADEGKNTINMGTNKGKVGTGAEALGGDHQLVSTTWQTPGEALANLRPQEYGEQRANYVNAAKGENTINIRNGKGEHQVKTGNIYEEEDEKKSDAAVAEEEAVEAESKQAEAEKTLEHIIAQSNQQMLEDTLGLADQSGNTEPAGLTNLAARTGLTEDAEAVIKRKAIGRYVSVSGDALLEAGGALATVVHTGQGENLKFYGIQRESDNNLLSASWGRTTRRSNGYGMYERTKSFY